MLRQLLAALSSRGASARPASLSDFIGVEDLAGDLPRPLRELLEQACRLIAKGRGEAAAAILDSAGKRFSRSAWPPALCARLAELSGAADRAEPLYALARARDAAVSIDDSVAQRLYSRGCEHLNRNQAGRARQCLEIAARLQPRSIIPLEMLGFAGYLDGDIASARTWYDQVIGLATGDERGILRLNRLIDTLPQIFESADHLRSARSEFQSELEALLAAPPRCPDPLRAIHRTPFFLCYQGFNDRALNERLARLFLAACPELGFTAAHVASGARRAGKLRVGFVSAFLDRHSIGAWYRGLIRLIIESGRFDTTLFTYGTDIDSRLKQSAQERGRHVYLGATLVAARAQIAAEELDALVYTDIGLHPFLYFLAFSRLASLQALLVGHPCTSGIPALDCFASNVFQDGESAQAHYSEKLVRMPRIPVWVERTAPPKQRMTRAELGWADDARRYLCPMMLQKMHPDFDWALAEILRRDPLGQVVLFADRRRPLWQEQLETRFARSLPDVAGRIAFRPFAPKEEFLNLLMSADCVLDPFHFSGGATTYIALSLGVPVITLPGELLRSRMTTGIYRQAGLEDCIARSREHFVELALRFAAERDLRERFGANIIAARSRIFETEDAVGTFCDWLHSALSGT